MKSSNTLCEALQDRGLSSLKKEGGKKMKRRAAIFGIAALLLITVAITPAFGQALSNATATVTKTANMTKTANATSNATASTSASTPGFEAVFAIAGLLAVAYLVMRQKR